MNDEKEKEQPTGYDDEYYQHDFSGLLEQEG